MQISGDGTMGVAVCPAGHPTVAPPVNAFSVLALLRTLPLGLRWPLAFGGALLGLTVVSWCRTQPLFLGARRWSMRGFAPLEALCRRVAGVSHPCMAQFPRLAGSLKGVVPKTQTTSAKNGEKGLFQVKWSVFWATLRVKTACACVGDHMAGILTAQQPRCGLAC